MIIGGRDRTGPRGGPRRHDLVLLRGSRPQQQRADGRQLRQWRAVQRLHADVAGLCDQPDGHGRRSRTDDRRSRGGDVHAPRLRQAAHKICALLSAFSTVGGSVASDLEDLATAGQLAEARPLVEQLEAMSQGLLRLADGLSLVTLRQEAEIANDPKWTSKP